MTGAIEERPDPDALLSRVRADEQRDRRAKLKVFFGFAPGVGKTYRMLQVAHGLAEQGREVLVGMVETHGRKETIALTEGLPLLPRRSIAYRGKDLEEFDLDAALRRKPSLLLLDELAHTNVPGSRHPKRWQDVIELLDAGIDVFTTLNVQHVESLNDVIAEITHVQVRETVPDSILDRADEIELVDLPPDELLGRLKAGKVYLGDAASRAADHFFKRGNLLALRELALRRTAERVDADVLAYRAQNEVDRTWATTERIMVCVGPSPASARLVRAARRMAAGLRAPWIAAYVDAPGRAPLLERDRERLESHLKLAESLGASIARLSDPIASAAILQYARRHNVTRIVIGKPTHSRLRDLLRGSFLDEIVRGSGDIDVNVIAGDAGAAQPAGGAGSSPREREEGAAPGLEYAAAPLVVAATTGLAWFATAILGAPDVEMLYLLGVMIVATTAGRGPAILTAGLSVAAFDFFCVPPRFTFAIHDARYGMTFIMMFGVGLVFSTLADRLKRQERAALDRESRTANLLSLSRDLAIAPDASAVAAAAVVHAAEVFVGSASFFRKTEDGEVVRVASSDREAPEATEVPAVVRWAVDNGKVAGLGTDTLPGSRVVSSPVRAAGATLGALVVEPSDGVALTAAENEFLDAFSRQVALALERVDLAEEARRAALRARTEELRSTLLSAVSHDLRTPLAVITGAATTLRDDASAGAEGVTHTELLETICDEAERLERLVANLLDMTRLESGVVLRKEWVPVVEIVETALARLGRKVRDREIVTRLPEELAMVEVDPVLAERLFVNLLENAAKYAPAPSPIEIEARSEDGRVTVDVLDRGPGIEPGDERRIFERFYRGRGARVQGVGLGLSICLAIATAHGAELTAANREGGGARFRVRFPAGGAPPTELPPPSAPRPGGRMSAGPLVLVVEDEPPMRRFLKAALTSHGYRLVEAETIQQATAVAATHNPEVILLDLGLPDGDGMELCRTLRGWTQVPVIVLSARGREDDKVEALDAGADDYLTKPFGIAELLARLRVALRHAQTKQAAPGPILEVGPVKIDRARREVWIEGEEVHLTPTEYRLLTLLVENAGRVLTHKQILHAVWGPNQGGHAHYVRVQVAELRKKIEEDPARPKWLVTEPAVGYRFRDKDAAG